MYIHHEYDIFTWKEGGIINESVFVKLNFLKLRDKILIRHRYRRLHQFAYGMSFLGIVVSIIALFSQLPLMQKYTWSFDLDIFVFLFILLDFIILFGVLGSKEFVRNRALVWMYLFLLIMNSLWELAGLSYKDIYQFHIWQNYLILFAGLLLLDPVRGYLSNIHKKQINISIDFNNENEKNIIDDVEKKEIFEEKYNKINSIPLLNKLALWFFIQGKGYSVGLASIFIIGFLIRLIFAMNGGIDMDEGIHTYDAKLIFSGLLPFRDYMTREPYYIYLLAIFVKIFGADLITARLLSVISSSLAIIIIYLIGKNISSKKVGLISASFFALSPFVIYNTYLGNLYGVYPLMLSLMILFTIYTIKRSNTLNLALSGLMAGFAAHFYRITIFYFPIFGFIFGLIYARQFGLRQLFRYYVFLSIPFIFPFIFFSLHAGYRNFEIIYGTNELIIGYIFILLGYVAGVLKVRYLSGKGMNKILLIFFSVVMIAFFSVSMFKFGAGFENKIKILFDSLIQNYHYVYIILTALFIYAKNIFINSKYIYRSLIMLLCCIFVFIAYLGYTSKEGLQLWGVSLLHYDFKYLFFVIVVMSLFISSLLILKFNFNKTKFPPYFGSLVLILIAPIPFLFVHAQWFAGYFMYFTVAGSVISAVGLIILGSLIKRLRLLEKVVIITVIIGIFCSPLILYFNYPQRERLLWTQKSYIEIGEYVQKNTSENEEVFTNALVYVTPHNRRSVMDLSRISLYAVSQVDMPDYIGTAKNLVPSAELAEYVKNNVNLILMDSRTKVIFNTNSDFADILDNYHIDKTWPKYEITAWKKNIN